MAKCNTLNAFSAETANNFQLDAGILVMNVTTPASLNYSTGTKLGATTGGNAFDFGMELRNLFEDVDGARGKYKGGDVIDMRDVGLSVTLLEATAENLKLALAAADIEVNDQQGKTIKPRNCIEDADYIKNICWFGTIKGNNKPICIELKNVINESFSFTAEDKGKGTIECEFHPRTDLASPDEPNFLIHTVGEEGPI